MKKIISIVICLLLVSTLTFAQNVQTSIDALTKQTNAVITVNKNCGIVQFVRFPYSKPLKLKGNTVYKKTMSFLEKNKGIYNVEDVNESFIHKATETDQYGLKRVVLTQVYNGVPIFDGKLYFHFNTEKKLTAINGNYISNIYINPIPSISQSQASSIALETIHNQNINFSGVPLQVKESTLYIFQKGMTQGYRGAQHLVYKVEVGNQVDVREFLFIDAHTGKLVEQYTGIAHAIDRTIYEVDTSNIVWKEGDPFPGTLNQWQQNEVVVSEHTYNFFKNAFGYVSYNGADIPMKVINNDPRIVCPNANWNGTTANFCDGTATDDIIAHEWGHAYTEYNSGLIYSWQSGALSESYSDIWGETVDLLNGYEDDGEDLSLRTGCNSSDRWMEGEDASGYGGAIRDMWDPTCKGDPGKVSDPQFWCLGTDQAGVHRNSGVPNHLYALLVDGGSYNGQTISGIGFTKAAHIFWRAQSQYLTETSGFITFADALEAATTDLMGINLEGLSTTTPAGPSGEIITANDLTQVSNTILAVELRNDPRPECFTTILQPLTIDLCEAATANPIFFEDWENGFGDWTHEELPVHPALWVPRDWMIYTGPLSNRAGNIAYGPADNYATCSTNGQEGIVRLTSPIITMPNDPNPIFEMAFNHTISLQKGYDGANIKYSVDGGNWNLVESSSFTENPYNYNALYTTENPLSGEPGFTSSDGAAAYLTWGTSVIDLSTLGVTANSTIQFRFEVGTDKCAGVLGWALDEIMVYNCESLSIADNSFENTIKAYPNPTGGVVNIKTTTPIKTLEVYNIYGQLAASNTSQDYIDLTGFSSGIYILKVTAIDGRSNIIKVLKE
ncbi:Zinc metalloprotease (elastase) [Aequorivita sublithincola DSM 14238]|uniref:Zinc metalloprotease (Elastase) n=1 Tax=Aequorivita sublithincola (strain DSM 14238 / LMG 21431 / ACAM 643 / 9-3) TaxID=746697 RepID=I3YXR6_AEQSU|nr:M4 family metallopeptidase [Aequorivita sublithincola]AFL81784.1 Zinc metalloprotease (elastase) [Aequorivita sublithincola DSM 14238]